MQLLTIFVLLFFGCLTRYVQAQAGTITTVAGGAPFVFQEGNARQAPLGEITSVAVDASGNVYAADRSNRIVVRIAPDFSLTIVSSLSPAAPGVSATARLAIDNSGNLYILENVFGAPPRITKIDASTGQASTIIQGGLADPSGLAVDSNGNLYVSEKGNDLVQSIAPDGTITTIAGNGTCGSSGEGGPAVLAQLCAPSGVAVDQAGNIYIADFGTGRVLRVTLDGTITRIAGNGQPGDTGDGGPALQAEIEPSGGIAVDPYGGVYFTQSNRIRSFSDGVIATLTGSTEPNFAGDGSGSSTAARFRSPQSVAVVPEGVGAYVNVYIADTGNWRVRELFERIGIMLRDVVNTVAGNGAFGISGDGGPATAAALNRPYGLAYDGHISGNLFYSDIDSHRVRKVDQRGVITTVAGRDRGFAGDGGPATEALLSSPADLAFDTAGNLYITDSDNGRIRRVGTDGIIRTVAGGGPPGATGDGIPAASAYLATPIGVTVDLSGNIYVVESGYIGRIRKITPNGLIGTVNTDRVLYYPEHITVSDSGILFVTVATYGNFSLRAGGVLQIATDGTITNAVSSMLVPGGVALGQTGSLTGSLFVSESFSESRVLRVDRLGGISQNQGVVAGTGTSGFSGDGPATDAMLDTPMGIVYSGGGGSLFIADSRNKRIRRVPVGPCFVPQLMPSSVPVPSSGGTGGFEVVTNGACAWTARSNADWIVVTKGTGSGPSPVFFSFTDNPQAAARTGSISVSGNLFTVNQDGARVSTGTFEPQLVTHLQAGYYIIEASLAQGASGGFWGLEVLTSSGQTSGGFNLGGGLSANAATPGFGAFFLTTPQTVTATAAAPLAPTANITLRLLDSNRQPIATNVSSAAGSSSLQAALQPGFYIVEITTNSPAPLNYSLALSADFFSGGVDVGGYIGPGITGFGAFYVPVEQDVSMHLFGKNTYGAAGAGSLVLTLRDANRNVLQQVGP
jgi:sugar lactone lactonase YvrE